MHIHMTVTRQHEPWVTTVGEQSVKFIFKRRSGGVRWGFAICLLGWQTSCGGMRDQDVRSLGIPRQGLFEALTLCGKKVRPLLALPAIGLEAPLGWRHVYDTVVADHIEVELTPGKA